MYCGLWRRPPAALKTFKSLSAQTQGHVLLLEYLEERPLMLLQTGMGMRLTTYYRCGCRVLSSPLSLPLPHSHTYSHDARCTVQQLYGGKATTPVSVAAQAQDGQRHALPGAAGRVQRGPAGTQRKPAVHWQPPCYPGSPWASLQLASGMLMGRLGLL